MRPITLIHLSDLHIHGLPRHPRHWRAKRLLGAMNLLLTRRRAFPRERLRKLVAQVDRMEWDYLVITGDLVQLGLASEFEVARHELAPLLARGPERVAILPGNHDHYVREGDAGTAFYWIFGDFFQNEDGFSGRPLGGPWWLALWDSTLPTQVGSAQGQVRAETFAATERWHENLPPNARIIHANHYPLVFPERFPFVPFHELRNLEGARAWLAQHPMEVLLHGHIHRPWVVSPVGGSVAYAPRVELPHLSLAGPGVRLSVNSASSSQRQRKADATAFHRLTLPMDAEGAVQVEAFAVES
jgi:3',5'-cyclic AMP phosphodiesterase CpdA